MPEGNGIFVHKSQKSVVLVYFRYRRLASDYRTEDAKRVSIRHLFDFLMVDRCVYLLFRV